jgi:hypothetical protein
MMVASTRRIEPWKTDEVRKHLQRSFREGRVEDYPKGAQAAHLFVVLKQRPHERHRVAHQLLVTRQFFDRFADVMALREALVLTDVAESLLRAGDRTVELY